MNWNHVQANQLIGMHLTMHLMHPNYNIMNGKIYGALVQFS